MTTPPNIRAHLRQSIARRHAAEQRFRWYGRASIAVALLGLAILLTSITAQGIGAFRQTWLQLEIVDAPEFIENGALASPNRLLRHSIRAAFPEVSGRGDRRDLYALFSREATWQLEAAVKRSPEDFAAPRTLWLLADDEVDTYIKSREDPTPQSRLNDQQRDWVDRLAERDAVEYRFNTFLFTRADSRNPETAGLRAALLGSFYMLGVTLLLAFPLGVMTAVYLEEFAPRNRLTDLLEISMNNLAAVPSVIFGLLGLAVFINFFGLPRSTPLVGGLVLTLMTLPTIIIAGRASLQAVPPSLREAALGIGASRQQMVIHHVLPAAMPGMLTGTIIGMAQALGESAPLLMIGMIAFVADPPAGVFSPATALPVQIFLWADSPERAFTERAAAAIMVLLAFLILMNSVAIWLRTRLERRG